MKFGENSERIAVLLGKVGVYANKYTARKHLHDVEKVNIKGATIGGGTIKTNRDIIGKHGRLPWNAAWIEFEETSKCGLVRQFPNANVSVEQKGQICKHPMTQVSMDVIGCEDIEHPEYIGNASLYLDENNLVTKAVTLTVSGRTLKRVYNNRSSLELMLETFGMMFVHTVVLLNEKAVIIDEEAEHHTSSGGSTGTEPFIKYKTINITLPKPARKRSVGTGKGKPKPRHERQNKPRDYTKGKGCFGKWNVVTKPDPDKPTYWVGSDKVGTVIRTGYNIKHKEVVTNGLQSV